MSRGQYHSFLRERRSQRRGTFNSTMTCALYEILASVRGRMNAGNRPSQDSRDAADLPRRPDSTWLADAGDADLKADTGAAQPSEPTSAGDSVTRLGAWAKVNPPRAASPGPDRGRPASRSGSERTWKPALPAPVRHGDVANISTRCGERLEPEKALKARPFGCFLAVFGPSPRPSRPVPNAIAE